MDAWKSAYALGFIDCGEPPHEVYWDMMDSNIITYNEMLAELSKTMTEEEIDTFVFYQENNIGLSEEVLTPKLRSELYRVFEKEKERRYSVVGHDYIYGYRACIVGDSESEKEYTAIANNFDLGYWDDTLEIDGVQYKVGFSFGS